ncbi:MAG: ATP-grasp domain-containing protein [Methanobacterium sp.]
MNNKYNIFILPAGSGMAIAAIKALNHDKKIRIISADMNKLAAGLYISDKGYLIPPFNDQLFYTEIEKIIEKEDIDVVIPALDTILQDFSNKKQYFNELGTKIMISEPNSIGIGLDKWKTYKKMKDIIPIPRSFIHVEDVDVDFPLLIKPRDGSGSENVFKIDDVEELNFFFKRVPNPIIQEYLSGNEYTVDCLADNYGNLLISIPRKRIETKAGISVKSQIVKYRELDNIAKKIAENIKFSGPFFFQVKEDDYGNPKLIEINPRISGTMSHSSHSGANLHKLAIQLLMKEKIKIPKINYGTYLTRYWEEIYLDYNSMKDNLEEIK